MLADAGKYHSRKKHTSEDCIPWGYDSCAAWDKATSNCHSSRRCVPVPTSGHGRMESQCLVDDGVEKGKLLQSADIADVRNTLELIKELIGQNRILG